MAPSTRSVQIYIKSNGNAFHKLWKSNPQQVPSLTPTNIHNCQINEGDVGNVGCILFWNYFHDGKKCVIKTITLDTDEGKKSVTFKGLEGDLLQARFKRRASWATAQGPYQLEGPKFKIYIRGPFVFVLPRASNIIGPTLISWNYIRPLLRMFK
ncbi:unnamed protein product [Lactuca virosa]|uniref:Bet v I/Major latex protein domain-containing protein n=1 Tax=Lactuca virosa TaxID=75947 RepID=A0AAU9LRK7_9ASTR|nr:unnamed protein product [Lactuca virosa]